MLEWNTATESAHRQQSRTRIQGGPVVIIDYKVHVSSQLKEAV